MASAARFVEPQQVLALVVADDFGVTPPCEQGAEQRPRFFVGQRDLEFPQQFLLGDDLVFLHADQAHEQLEDLQLEQLFTQQVLLLGGGGGDDVLAEVGDDHVLAGCVQEAQQFGGLDDADDGAEFAAEAFGQVENIAGFVAEEG